MGCSRITTPLDTDPGAFACLVVRCEDDGTTGFYVHTSRREGDVGRWLFTLDRDWRTITTVETPTPYGASIIDAPADPAELGTLTSMGHLDWIAWGVAEAATVFITPEKGEVPRGGFIHLEGAATTIRSALQSCTPQIGLGAASQ